MTWLLEDPTPTLAVGALLITMAAIVYTSLRTRASFAAVVAAVLLTLAGAAIEWCVETPKEQVAHAMDRLLAAVEANDLDGVLQRIDPSAATILAKAERLMPEFEVDKANRIDDLKVTLEGGADPTGAEVACRVFVSARHRRTGTKGGDLAELRFHFTRRRDQQRDAWLLDAYSGDKKWKRGAAELSSKR